ncbi:hypothetical protein GCM10023340_14680 [Nocardioides marinquilinus]|uniref:Ribulose 1,5-bisphosphate carboxylase large subunit n=1 Tax=Nocardioides marinquilinus TaxID=1210400 RepID=A0ABP9PGP1_9ACTN
MRLPIPGPSDVRQVLDRGRDQLQALVDAVPRVLALLDAAEVVVARAAVALDRVEAVTRDAATVALETATVVDLAQAEVMRVAGLVERLAPTLTTLLPLAERVAAATGPDDVDAAVRLTNRLPGLTDRVEHDVLPVIDLLRSVAPDLRELLDVSRELNEMLGHVPGMGRIKKNLEREAEESGEPEASGAAER